MYKGTVKATLHTNDLSITYIRDNDPWKGQILRKNFHSYINTPPRVQQPLVGQGHYGGFTITLIHTTLGRTTLDEWSAWHRDLYLTIHDIYMRETSKPPAGFKPAIPASQRPQTHALDRAATGIGSYINMQKLNRCGSFMSSVFRTIHDSPLTLQRPRKWTQLRDFGKGHFFLKSIHASPLCPSGKSNVYMKMSREHWWNDTDSRKPKYSEKYLSQCHFIDHNSEMD